MQVSVVVPAHDEAATIAATLESLVAQAGPGIDLELVVVANGCTDDTVAIARSAVAPTDGVELQVIEIDEASKAAALNCGVAESSGRIRFYCDADIVVGPGSLAAMIDALEQPGIELVSARHRLIPPTNRFVRGWAAGYHASPYQRGDDVVHHLFGVWAEGGTGHGPFPEGAVDDRFLTVSYPSSARRRVDDAVVEVRYTESPRRLLAQQARWVAFNDAVDRRYPELVEANPPRHEAARRPYFEPRPALVDIVCFGVVTVGSRVGARIRRDAILGSWARARPD